MKAIVCNAFGAISDLEYADWPEPEATGDTLVIEAQACGMNFPDGLLVQGLYQMKPDLPFVPGMEVAGRVIAAGPDVKRLKQGDRIAALLSHGGYAERVAISEKVAVPLPDGLDPAEACAMLVAYGTAHYALKQRAALQPGETLFVPGAAGNTGIAAIQVGKAMGARVLAAASTPQKQEVALQAGADEAFGYENLRDALKTATGGKGVDVAFDSVGGETFDVLSRAMGWGGRLLVIGFASGAIPKLPVNLTLVKSYSVVGVFWGAFTAREPKTYAANNAELFGWWREGKIRPVVEGRYPLSQAPAVLKRIMDRGATGKLVLVP